MAISAGYVVKETATNLRRNLLMTLAAILTVALSLAFFGGALLLRQAVNKQTARWRGGVELSIFMKADSSDSQVDAGRTQLNSQPGVKSFRFVDHAAAFKEMKELFADQPNVLDTLTQDQAPPSFRVVPTKAELVDTIGGRFDNQPGVYRVVYARDAIKKLVQSTNQKKLVGMIVACVFLVSAALLILTTIQLPLLSPRRGGGGLKVGGA